MPNTYSSNLRLIVQTTGENANLWGNYTNTNIATLLEQAVTGMANITVSGSSDYTLTVVNGASDESRNAILNVTGTLTAAINVICPAVTKLYIVKNATTGGYAITLKTASGTGISVPNGASMLLYCNGTNVVESLTYFNSFSTNNLSYSGTFTGSTGVVNIGSGQIYKDGSGNVGLGTTAPGDKLVVRADGVSSTTWVTSQNDTATGGYGAGFIGRAGAKYFTLFENGSGDTVLVNQYASGNTILGTASTERMRIDASGNVSIGTTSGNGTNSITTYSGAGTANGFFGTVVGHSAFFFGANNSGSAVRGVASGVLGIGTSDTQPIAFSTSNTERLRIDASGNVGIGTSLPAYKLDVLSGSVRVGSGTGFRIDLGTSGAGTYRSAYINGDGANLMIANQQSGYLAFNTNNTETMRVDASGNVGIGTTSPGQKLSVAGTIESTSGGFKFPDGTTQATAGTASAAANGYQKLPSGVIIQWLTSGAGTTATFPIAFPNAFLNAVVQENYNGSGYNNNVVYISGSSTTGLTFAASSISGRRIIAIGY